VLAVNGILILTHLHKKKKVEEPAEKSGDPILSSLRKEHPQDWKVLPSSLRRKEYSCLKSTFAPAESITPNMICT
jgi:hypothetical protein